MFRKNTAAFVHDLPNEALSNVVGDSNYLRVQVLTNAGALDREKQLRSWLQLQAATHPWRTGHRCCSPRPLKAAGDSAVMPTPMPSSWMPRARRSPSYSAQKAPGSEHGRARAGVSQSQKSRGSGRSAEPV